MLQDYSQGYFGRCAVEGLVWVTLSPLCGCAVEGPVRATGRASLEIWAGFGGCAMEGLVWAGVLKS